MHHLVEQVTHAVQALVLSAAPQVRGCSRCFSMCHSPSHTTHLPFYSILCKKKKLIKKNHKIDQSFKRITQ